ncbi:MAG UNVERIFIED_CONTAM: YqaJ viral recombinase family protein [Thermobifida fusca]
MKQEPTSRRAATADAREGISRLQAGEDVNARLILPPDAPREEWLAARRQGVTASEIAVILGISPFDSPFNLYYKKRGEISEDFDNTAMSLGRHLEPWIADRWAEAHPEYHVGVTGLWQSLERPWQMATPDRLLWDRAAGEDWRGRDSVLEVKSSGTYDGWGEDGSDEIPTYYRAQVLWQLDTLGLTEGHVTCLFLSTRSIRNYVVPYDAHDVELMRDAAQEFLARVDKGEPPEIDHTPATTAALKSLFPDVEDAEAQIDDDLAYAYRTAKADLDDAKAAYDLICNELRARMGEAKRAVTKGGEPVATRSKYTVAEHVRKATTVDKLIPAKPKKDIK